LKDLSSVAGNKLIIRYVDMIHSHSDHLREAFEFEIRDPFDPDAATDEVRKRIDSVWAPNNPKSKWKGEHQPTGALTPDHQQQQQEPDVDAAVDRLLGPERDNDGLGLPAAAPPRRPPPRVVSPPADPETVEYGDDGDESWDLSWGMRVFRNVAERRNVIRLGLIEPGTFVKRVYLYKASISPHIVKWFAGQEHHVMNNGDQIIRDVNAREVRRSPVQVTEWAIYERNHSLLAFIREFAEQLNVTGDDFSYVQDNRSQFDTKFVKIRLSLIQRAQKMIKEVVYAQIYYTTLRSCHLVHVPPRDDNISAFIAARMLCDWGEDWEQRPYKPSIVLTFEVGYYVVVSGDKNAAAAAIRKDVTKIKSK
jgi:hypothetical protein